MHWMQHNVRFKRIGKYVYGGWSFTILSDVKAFKKKKKIPNPILSHLGFVYEWPNHFYSTFQAFEGPLSREGHFEISFSTRVYFYLSTRGTCKRNLLRLNKFLRLVPLDKFILYFNFPQVWNLILVFLFC